MYNQSTNKNSSDTENKDTKKKEKNDKKSNKKKKYLDTYGTNLTVKAKSGQIDEVIGLGLSDKSL